MACHGSNDGAEIIIEEINREADRQVEEILRRARTEAEGLLAEARERAELKAEWILRKARTQAEIERQRIVASAKLEIRKKKLDVQESLINETMDVLRGRLSEMPDEEYFDVLVGLIADAVEELETDEVVVSGNERTLRLLRERTDEVVERLPGVTIRLGDVLESMGGVVVTSPDGNVRVDNTFESRMERLREELRAEIARALFGAG